MPEIVLISGPPAGGKSTLVKEYTDKGYLRFNRDLKGGTVAGLIPEMKRAGKSNNFVLDNVFATKESRRPFVEFAKQIGADIRCLVLDTSLEEAQFNACTRMYMLTGKILEPNDKTDSPNLFPMAVLYKWRKEYQAPSTDEGFTEVKKVKFVRQEKPYKAKALILDYDGCLRETLDGSKFPTDPKNIRILPGRSDVLKEYEKAGYLLLGVSNQSGVAKGALTHEMARDCFDMTNKLLGVHVDVAFCPHKVPPITCYCRKPGCGLGVYHIEKWRLDRKQCVMVGDMTTDKTFAARCGFQYCDADKFFGGHYKAFLK